MSEPILQLNRISKTYRSESGAPVVALNNVDLALHEGEFVVLIGPTGCGKTTLLNIVAGLDAPDGGSVFRATDLKPGINIPCVFQHYTLFPWRTILHNIAFGLEMRGVPRGERHDTASGLLSRVGLKGFEHAYPHELSGGMRQRAAIAQALASQPKLLLMDEPFGAVDDTARQSLQDMIIKLWRESQLTILFVTHNIDEAVVLADRVVVFSGQPGRIIEELPIELPRPRERTTPEVTEMFVHVRRSLSSGEPEGKTDRDSRAV
jgi:NitT/TauT family transport system ATP-binding protein